MTAPPPGWYPDPEAAGRQWRWWDGVQWAPPGYGYPVFDPVARAHALELQARSVGNTGTWLPWAMVGNALATLAILAGLAVFLHAIRTDWLNDDGEPSRHVSNLFVVGQATLYGLQLVAFGFMILLIAWIFQAGKFAELQGWPRARGPLLGALSLLIPVVNLWWPYEAVRDAYPPGSHPPIVLRWWLGYLIAPVVGAFPVLIAGLSGSAAAAAICVVFAAGALAVPVVLGWRLVRDVDAIQRAHLAR